MQQNFYIVHNSGEIYTCILYSKASTMFYMNLPHQYEHNETLMFVDLCLHLKCVHCLLLWLIAASVFSRI